VFGHVWHLALEGTFYEVRLALVGFPRSVVVYVNGQPALKERRAERRGPYEFRVGTHPARILVSDGAAGELSYYLTVDGQPVASTTSPGQPIDANARTAMIRQRTNGAGWLTWIGLFSGINSVLSLGGSTISFVTGLALTYFIDGVFMAIAHVKSPPPEATVVDLALAGMFVVFGRFAARGVVWPFLVGMVIYSVDAGIFLLFGEWLSVAFHAFALWWIFRGWRAARTVARMPDAPPITVA
jgi:hypothetical protein